MSEHPFLQSSLLCDAGFPAHGFTTRKGGCSPAPYDSWNFSTSTGDHEEYVEENYAILGHHLGVLRQQIRGVRQVHSARVVELSDVFASTSDERADALISLLSDQIVGVKTADCVPILFALPGSRLVAAVHAGWRGVVSGIVAATVQQMRHHAPDEQLLVAIGPHICADCFQVGPEVAAEFPLHHRPDFKADGKFVVDLRGALDAQLDGLGIKEVEHVQGCTVCDPAQRFFSHRASGGNTGRMFNFIGAQMSLL